MKYNAIDVLWESNDDFTYKMDGKDVDLSEIEEMIIKGQISEIKEVELSGLSEQAKEKFISGFLSAAPENYCFEADTGSPAPWACPWYYLSPKDYFVGLQIDVEKSGELYAKKVFAELEAYAKGEI